MRIARRCALLLLAALAATALVGGGTAAATCTTFAPAILDGSGRQSFGECAGAVLTVDPTLAAPGELVTLDGSDSTGDGDPIVSYDWDFDGDDIVDESGAASSTTHTYARGAYTVRLTIVGGDARTLTATAPLTVGAPPVAAIDAPEETLRPGVEYAFDASGSVPDAGGTIVRYDWDFGDGTRLQTTTPVVNHTFARDDASTQVSVVVVNDLGLASAPARAAITVANQLPVVQVLATPTTVPIGQTVTLDASGSRDPDGEDAGLKFQWNLGFGWTLPSPEATVTAGPFPNAGDVQLYVRVIDDSGDSTRGSVLVTVTSPPSGGGGSGGGAGSGSGGGSGGDAGSGDSDSGDSGSGGSSSGGGRNGGGSGGGAGSGGGGTSGDAFAVGLSGRAIQRLKGVLRRGIALSATANRTASGRLAVLVGARDARKLRLSRRRGKRPIAIGTVKLSLAPGRTAKPKIKLKRKAARALRRKKPRSLRVTVRGSLTADAGRAKVTRIVLLRR